MQPPLTFRTRVAQALAILVAVVAVVALAAFVGSAGPAALLPSLAPVALVVAMAWAVFWLPCAQVSDDGVTLVNVARTVHVPWGRFRSADTRWALSITTTDDRTFTSWAVPAGSGFGARTAPPGRWSGDRSPADRKLASQGTAEAAAVAIGEHVSDRRSGRAAVGNDDDNSGEVTVTLNMTPLAVLAALATLTAISVALG